MGYRPHPKDGEGNVFTGICPSTHRGWVYPSPSQGMGTPVPRGGGGGICLDWGTHPPQPGQDWHTARGQDRNRVLPSQNRTGVPPPPRPRQDWCTPHPGQDCDTPQSGLGYSPSPGDRTAERVLRSRRRTCL